MAIEESQIKKLVAEAIKARLQAYAPYSSYDVGAAVLTDEGKIFLGCNVENSSYGLSMCAERVAVYNAISGEVCRIEAVAVAADDEEMPRPCGACLQVIAEFADESAPIITVSKGGEYEVRTLADYLPMPFKL